MDGAANQKGFGVELVLISPEKIIIEKSLRLDFSATNNETEYEALLMGMAMVRRMGEKSVKVFSDSRLVVGQVRGEFEAKDERIQGYLSRVKHLTTPRRSTGKTPFSMTYGAEAVIPLETRFSTMKNSSFSPTSNNEQLEKSFYLIKEQRENAMVRLAHYQQKLRKGYDANVKLRPLEPGDLVFRKVVGTAKNPAWGKLGPNWEGPYRITSGASIGAYFLEDLDSHVIPRP
ncbi:uncharacterized protein LOC136068728 [Quercus suber]|uniref:uncharacterized protein LOC136068728 n=1 Tax=Quercus suber TaxID=58331 RepID=UPI0032DE7663